MSDQWTARLSEYLDGTLDPVERHALETHLRDCPDCAAVLADLRAVVERAAGLPAREPARDLWEGIATGIGVTPRGTVIPIAARRRRYSFSLPQLLAAAAALVLVSAGGVWAGLQLTGSARPDTIAAAPAPAPVAGTPAGLFDPRGRADSAIAELEAVLRAGRGELDSTTVRVLEENLALIDRAISQARQALAKDPGNPYLNEHLARTMRKKIEVLRQAADLAAVAS